MTADNGLELENAARDFIRVAHDSGRAFDIDPVYAPGLTGSTARFTEAWAAGTDYYELTISSDDPDWDGTTIWTWPHYDSATDKVWVVYSSCVIDDGFAFNFGPEAPDLDYEDCGGSDITPGSDDLLFLFALPL